MKPVIQIIDDVMAQIKDYGSEQSTINMMYYGIFKPIINRHDKEGVSEYTVSIVEDFRNEYENRFVKNEISQSYMATVRRSLRYLTSCAETGKVDFSRAKKPLKTVPNDYHMKLTDECMGGVSSSEGHRSGISIFIRHFFCFVESHYPESIVLTDDMFRAFILDASIRYPRSVGYVMQSVRILADFLRSKGLLVGTVRKGVKDKMSDDNVARFMNKYENKIRETIPDYPHLHPHLLRHSRAMNLYIYGMPLTMISEWLGHTQLETTTIYAQATTEMKRRQAEKAEKANSKVFKDDVFNYANDDETIKRLYGLK